MAKASTLFSLARPLNSAAMSLAILVGAVLSDYSQLAPLNLLLGSITAFTLTAAAMALNDYYDYGIDVINEPKRPLPSGEITKNQAIIFTAALTIIGIACAYLVSIYCLAFAVFAWAIMASYSTVGKRTGFPGNILVSICVAAPFLYGSLITTNQIMSNVLLFAAMAFLANTGREITKGIVDVEGDASHNIKTLAVAFGEKKAAISASILFISAVLLSPIALLLGMVSVWFVPFVLVTDIGLVWCCYSILKKPTRENSRRIKKLVLIFFIFGLLSFIAGMIR